MINRIGFIAFMIFAVYQHTVHHNETAFVHWMLWSIVCGIGVLIQEKK
jgi:hypothetical protein